MRSHAIGLGASIVALGLLASSTARAQAIVSVFYQGTPPRTTPKSGNTAIDSFSVPSGDDVLAPGSIGEASADLAAGTMRAYMSTMGLASAGGSDPLSGDLSVQANLSDMITVSGPAGPVDVTLSLSVDGSFGDVGAIPMSARTEARVQTDVGSPAGLSSRVEFFRYNVPQADGGGVSYQSLFSQDPGAPIVSPSTINSDSFAYTHTFHITATVGTPTPVAVDLVVLTFPTRSQTSFSDFGNTARFSITLPAGYTYTSASGILLTDSSGTGLLLDGGGASITPTSDGGGGNPKGDGGGGTTGTGDGGASNGNGANGDSGSSGGCAVAAADDPPFFLAALTMGISIALFGKRRRKK